VSAYLGFGKARSSPLSSVTEQPLKIPFVASIILYANEQKADIAHVIIDKAGKRLQETLEAAEWRSFKLILRFLAYMTGLFEGEGVMPLLDDLFNKAADLQTESNDDVRYSAVSG
jgi:nuclear cap-binding protein subunit 1